MQTKLLQIRTLSSTRVGAGRGLGHIDLPVVRERATNYPYIPGSSIKGVLRDADKNNKDLKKAFGREAKTPNAVTGEAKAPNAETGAGAKTPNAETEAGAFIFTDARILALPILSFYGTFALVTCPTILARLQDDLKCFKSSNAAPGWAIPTLKGNQIRVGNPSVITAPAAQANQKPKVYLLDVDFESQGAVDSNYNAVFNLFPALGDRRDRFAIVSDEAFGFLCETGTEVNAHIRIQDETKIVAKGGLWYEETLPAETLLYGFVACDSDDQLLDSFYKANPVRYLQFGGKASTGKGRCVCTFKNF